VNYQDYILNDLNSDIINFWRTLQQEERDFIERCKLHFRSEYNTKEQYYEIRKRFNLNRDPEDFLYLNRHCFNGLCRYNKDNKFNVPFGKYKDPYFPREEMEAALPMLRKAKIFNHDFRVIFDKIEKGDIVYCDPPYVPISDTSSFTSYSSGGFSMVQQQSLTDCAWAARKRGAIVVLSNQDTPVTRNLYKGAEIFELEVQRNISCKGNSRKKVKELIVVFKE
jgi:DNA adenine methylase